MTKVLMYGMGNAEQLFPDCEVVLFDPDNPPDESVITEDAFDVVYLGHVLQHYPRDGVSNMLKEFVGLVKPMGELWAVVPSLEWACSKIIREDNPDPIVYVSIYGYDNSQHLSGFTLNWLRAVMQVSGLVVRKAVQEKLHMGNGSEIIQNICIGLKPGKEVADEGA